MIVLRKKHILAGVLGTTLLIAGYINYKSQPVDISGRITDNVGEASFVVNMKENVENIQDGNNKLTDTYFVSARLEKEQTYDKQVEYHEDIMFNESSDESIKAMAQEQIKSIVNNMSKEMSIEKLLEAKGFEEALAIINNENVNVIVKTMDELNVAQVAQIQSIVMREAGAKPENIHIITKR